MPIQTVTELTQSIKLILENGFSFITVIGEISNLRKPYSGHLYFTLKDSRSQIKAVLFKMQQRYLSCPLEEGKEVICHGRISVYEPRGEYQLIIDSVEYKGEGALQIAFEKLKHKLSEEGLFDRIHKKPLPFLPKRITVITSPSGAAIHDFLKISTKRCPSVPIDIYPVRVQGDEAAADIRQAIQLINKNQGGDLIVLCRGGGSIEDLWPFNDELLARAIFASSIPIISAIGHEIDFSIADFTADFRAPTPTAAAEAALPDATALLDKIYEHKEKMAMSIKNRIAFLESRISSLKRILGSPRTRISHAQMKIDYAVTRCDHALTSMIQKKRYALLQAEDRLISFAPSLQVSKYRMATQTMTLRCKKALELFMEDKKTRILRSRDILKAISPLAILDRGYALVQSQDKKTLIRSKTQVVPGDIVDIRLSDGVVISQILPDTEI